MTASSILIVDDEKNIRMTLSHALAALSDRIDTAENGAQALEKIAAQSYSLVLLDIKMPEMDGMEVLARLRQSDPNVPVVMITAYGSVDTAVEAMKLGAVDFLQKPFTPAEIRETVSAVLGRALIDEKNANDYQTLTQLAKRRIAERRFEDARECLQRAVAAETTRPEAYNLLGAIHEILCDVTQAQKFYRAALALNPAYEPAQKNLSRTVSWRRDGEIILEDKPSGK